MRHELRLEASDGVDRFTATNAIDRSGIVSLRFQETLDSDNVVFEILPPVTHASQNHGMTLLPTDIPRMTKDFV